MPVPMHAGWNERLQSQLLAPVDNASLTFFRLTFGAVLAYWAWDYLALGRVSSFLIEPNFHFTYYCFDWIKPLPGNGMYVLFLCMVFLAASVAAGLRYRITSALFCLAFAYVFLLDRTNYQNHYYLILLISLWLPFLPLNNNVSVDVYHGLVAGSQTSPAWVLWILRFHLAIPYFFGGIAKLDADWLRGAPLQQMLEARASMPIIGPILSINGVGIVLAWSAMLFDLAIVPLLIWRKTRAISYCVCVLFHLINSVIFNIHVFPWMMILSSLLFFDPAWPRKLLGGRAVESGVDSAGATAARGERYKLATAVVACYLLFHCVWPLRHFLYEGNANWTERGHHFAWRMMLRGKMVVLGYAVKDKVTGKVANGDVRRYLNEEQAEKFGKDPYMILQFAHFLAQEHEQHTGHEAEVYALAFASLNGRKPELMIDPNVNLANVPRDLSHHEFIASQSEPLRHTPWNIPAESWQKHLKIPRLQFLETGATVNGADDNSALGLITR